MITLHVETIVAIAVVVLAFTLLLWHIGVHNWRERQARECRKQISILWSFNQSLFQRYVLLAERFAEKFPEDGEELRQSVRSLDELFRRYQEKLHQPVLNIDAAGDVIVGGDVVGGSKQEKP